jgi:alpha-tubulin suppressor-like RCC1 family protein
VQLQRRESENMNNRKRAVLAALAVITVLAGGVTYHLRTASGPDAKIRLPDGEAIVAVAVADWYTVALTPSGKVFTWGENDRGQLGDGNAFDSATPKAVVGLPSDDPIVSIAASHFDSIALTRGGTAYMWGSGVSLGGGLYHDSDVAKAVRGLPKGERITAIAAGDAYQLVLTNSGTVYTLNPISRLRGLPNGDPVIAIASATSQFYAITRAGKLFAGGFNYNGDLGIGSYQEAEIKSVQPVANLAGGDAVGGVAIGEYYALALSRDGKLYGWGDNSEGQLGFSGDGPDKPIHLTLVPGDPRIVAIAAEGDLSAALTSSGTIYAWGGGSKDRHAPIALAGLPEGEVVATIATNGADVFALTRTGTLYSWHLG